MTLLSDPNFHIKQRKKQGGHFIEEDLNLEYRTRNVEF